jgi:hypothetical protein
MSELRKVVITDLVNDVGTHVNPDGSVGLRVHAELTDNHDNQARFSPIRDLPVAQHFRLAGVPFHDATIDNNFWQETVSGAGAAVTQLNGACSIVSGTANNGYAQMQSVQFARFMFAHPMLYRGAIRLPDLTELGNTRRFGAYTVGVAPAPEDGHYFEVDENGALSLRHVKGGVVSTVASGAFNGDVSSFVLDTDVHAFEIEYFVMEAKYYIDNLLLHTFAPGSARFANTTHFPITMQSVNGAGGTEPGEIQCFDTVITRYGRDTTAAVSFHHPQGVSSDLLKRGPGAVHALLVGEVGANAQIILYDNTAAAGAILYDSGQMPATTQPFPLPTPNMPFYTGLTLDVSGGAGASVTVIYE